MRERKGRGRGKPGGTFCVGDAGDEVDFCEVGYAAVHATAAAETGELCDERCGNDFVVAASLLHLSWVVS